jgi:hypothetical protein
MIKDEDGVLKEAEIALELGRRVIQSENGQDPKSRKL